MTTDLSNCYATIYSDDEWSLLRTDSVSTVMRLSKGKTWCTKDREDAGVCLGEGDLVFFKKHKKKRPTYALSVEKLIFAFYNSDNKKAELGEFLENRPDMLTALASEYPNMPKMLEQERYELTLRHQQLYRRGLDSSELTLEAVQEYMHTSRQFFEAFKGVPWLE